MGQEVKWERGGGGHRMGKCQRLLTPTQLKGLI